MPKTFPEYVGFGMLTPVEIMVLDQLPKHNTGAIVTEVNDFVFDDAAIIACLLRQWDVSSAMIGTAVGDDDRGHALAKKLKEWGVQGQVRFTKEYRTPIEVNVSDRKGARTYFWHRTPQMLNTLDTADLKPIRGAKILYADWYDGEHVIRAMDEANRLDVPVFFNFEHGHKNKDLLKKYAGRVSVCQAVTDAAQLGKTQAMLSTANKILKSGIKTALVTMAKDGCLVAEGKSAIRVYAPKVKAVDACGAGATLSAGFIYGYLKGWGLEEATRFGVAAASLKVTRAGLQMFPVEEIKALASRLDVVHLAFKENQLERIGKVLLSRRTKILRDGQHLANLAKDKLLPKKKSTDKKRVSNQAKSKPIL